MTLENQRLIMWVGAAIAGVIVLVCTLYANILSQRITQRDANAKNVGGAVPPDSKSGDNSSKQGAGTGSTHLTVVNSPGAILNVNSQTSSSPAAALQLASVTTKPTAVMLESGTAFLPLKVPPHSDLNFVALRPNQALGWGVEAIRNERDEPYFWPFSVEERKARALPPEFVPWYAVTNNGVDRLMEITLDFEIVFRETNTSQPGQVSTGSNSPIVATLKHQVIIKTLKPEASYQFHFINESPYGVSLRIPDIVTAKVFGEEVRREIKLSKPISSVTDLMGLIGGGVFVPSQFNWEKIVGNSGRLPDVAATPRASER